MEVLHDLEPKTNHIRLGAQEYIIIHTPKGTIDIDVNGGVIDLGEKSTGNFTVRRWTSMKRPVDILPVKVD
jgi:hypothetical protein